jgi:hypothetical protein
MGKRNPSCANLLTPAQIQFAATRFSSFRAVKVSRMSTAGATGGYSYMALSELIVI